MICEDSERIYEWFNISLGEQLFFVFLIEQYYKKTNQTAHCPHPPPELRGVQKTKPNRSELSFFSFFFNRAVWFGFIFWESKGVGFSCRFRNIHTRTEVLLHMTFILTKSPSSNRSSLSLKQNHDHCEVYERKHILYYWMIKRYIYIHTRIQL